MLRKFITALFTATILLGTSIASAEVVNINKADAAALAENLNGIGPVKSKAIVDYRRKHGNFKSIEDLANVEGVGEELIKTNRQSLSLSRGTTTATGKPKAASKTGTKKTSKKPAGKKPAASASKTTKKAKKGSGSTTKKTSAKKTAKKATSTDKKKAKKSD